MRRCLGRTCGCVLLAAVAGCAVVTCGPKEVVTGTVAQTAAKLQDGFREARIDVISKQAGEEYRLAGQSNSGTAFCLHLRQKKVGGTTKTLVSMWWDLGGDEELWKLVRQWLKAPEPQDADQL